MELFEKCADLQSVVERSASIGPGYPLCIGIIPPFPTPAPAPAHHPKPVPVAEPEDDD